MALNNILVVLKDISNKMGTNKARSIEKNQ